MDLRPPIRLAVLGATLACLACVALTAASAGAQASSQSSPSTFRPAPTRSLTFGYVGTMAGPRHGVSTHDGGSPVVYDESVASPGAIRASFDVEWGRFRVGGAAEYQFLLSDDAPENRSWVLFGAAQGSVGWTRIRGRRGLRIALQSSLGIGPSIVVDQPIGPRDRLGLACAFELAPTLEIRGAHVGFVGSVGYEFLATFDRDRLSNRYLTTTHLAEASFAVRFVLPQRRLR